MRFERRFPNFMDERRRAAGIQLSGAGERPSRDRSLAASFTHSSVGLQEHDRFRKVTIFPAAVSDSGEYRCAVGPNGLLSNGYMVKVVG